MFNSKINTLHYYTCAIFIFLLLPVSAVGIDAIKLNLEEQRRYLGVARQTIEITKEGDLHGKLLQKQSIDQSCREVITDNQIKQHGDDIGEKTTKLCALNKKRTDFLKATQSDSEEELSADETKNISIISPHNSLAKITPEQLAKDAWDEYAKNYHIPNKLGNLLKDLTGTRVIGKGHYKIDDKKRRRDR